MEIGHFIRAIDYTTIPKGEKWDETSRIRRCSCNRISKQFRG